MRLPHAIVACYHTSRWSDREGSSAIEALVASRLLIQKKHHMPEAHHPYKGPVKVGEMPESGPNARKASSDTGAQGVRRQQEGRGPLASLAFRVLNLNLYYEINKIDKKS